MSRGKTRKTQVTVELSNDGTTGVVGFSRQVYYRSLTLLAPAVLPARRLMGLLWDQHRKGQLTIVKDGQSTEQSLRQLEMLLKSRGHLDRSFDGS